MSMFEIIVIFDDQVMFLDMNLKNLLDYVIRLSKSYELYTASISGNKIVIVFKEKGDIKNV